jgi:hypothetical protein
MTRRDLQNAKENWDQKTSSSKSNEFNQDVNSTYSTHGEMRYMYKILV